MIARAVYHSADFDGIFCREIARLAVPGVELVGWNFGDPPIEQHPEDETLVMDLPPSCLKPPVNTDRLIWIDHHKSSIDEWSGAKIRGYRIDGVAACRLAWQWFFGEGESPGLPVKEDYVDRDLPEEPLAVRLAGEYDIWDHRDPRAAQFQFGLRSVDEARLPWKDLLSCCDYPSVHKLIDDGAMLQAYQQRMDAQIVASRTFILEWEGLKFLTMTSPRCNSLTFAARDLPETGHDALMAFYYVGSHWTVSMYHAGHRKDLDLSKIAVKHGGGGHRGACGFTCLLLPFTLPS